MLNKIAVRMALGALFSFGLIMTPALAEAQTQQPIAAPSGPVNWNSLNLTPAQVKRINDLRHDYSKKVIPLRASISLKQLDIQKQLMSPIQNPSLVRKLLQEKLVLESELQAASLDNFLAIKKLLTPQQLAKLPSAITVK